MTVCGEEEYMVSHLNTFKYVEMDGEFIETPCQTFEVVPPTKIATAVPKVARTPSTMASLKDAQAVVEDGGSPIWGQLPDIPHQFHKLGLGFTSQAQKAVKPKPNL